MVVAKKTAARKVAGQTKTTRRAAAKRSGTPPRPPAYPPLRYSLPRGAIYDHERALRARRFVEGYLVHMKARWAGTPFLLEEWQWEHVIRPLFGTVEKKTGLRWYRQALIGLPRKNGKSELAAAITLYMLFADKEWTPEVYSLAGDKKQARIVFKAATDMAKASPYLKAMGKFYRSVLEVPENGGLYQALSADADLQHGSSPHCAVIDEYHIHKNDEQYEAMASGTGAREEPLTVVITTAGNAERGPCWDLYQRAQSGTNQRLYFYWVGAPDGADASDPETWRIANPASWITQEYLAQQFHTLPRQSFERLHLNRWPSGGGGDFLPPGAWEDCSDKPSFDFTRPVIVAVDGSYKRDFTAIAVVQRGEDDLYNVAVYLFKPDETLGYVDLVAVEEHLRGLYRDLQVERVLCDPALLAPMMIRLAQEGLPVDAFVQGKMRIEADMLLYELIVDGRLRHGGDAELSEEIGWVVLQELYDGKWRMDKARSGGKIDGLIAVGMACWLAEKTESFTGHNVIIV